MCIRDSLSYTFYSSTDDYSYIYLDGVGIFNTSAAWNGGWGGTYTYSQNINPGNHTISIYSVNRGGPWGMRFALRNNGDGTFPVVSTSDYFTNIWWDGGPTSPHPVPAGWPEGRAHWIWGYGNWVYATFNAPLVCPDGYTLNAIDFMCYKDTLADSVVDNCSSLENNSDCKLQSETVDGVVTYNNFNPTGLSPVPSCKTFSGAVQAFSVCHDWWIKNRTYLCRTQTAYDLSAIKERAKNISNTVNAGSSSFSYQDKTLDSSGGWYYSSNTVDANTTGGTTTCVTACKTRKPATNTQASLTGTTAQSNVSTDSWEFFYKACSGDTCPIGAGEEVLIGCQCISEFAEAATIMETISQAGKDLICSDGTRQ